MSKKAGINIKLFCTHFKKGERWSNAIEGIFGWESGENLGILTKNDNYNTAEKMKVFLLANDVQIYYELATATKLECTAEQTEVLEYLTKKVKTYKNVTNITTDSIALLNVTYKKDRDTTDSNLQKQIDELKALLSTTNTSAMLLDNMQTDLESEVMSC